MKSKKAETGIQKWERIKEGMKEYTRLSWQRNGHLRIDLNSVGPRISLLHIHSTDAGVDYEEMSEEDIDAYLDFMHGPVLPNIFID